MIDRKSSKLFDPPRLKALIFLVGLFVCPPPLSADQPVSLNLADWKLDSTFAVHRFPIENGQISCRRRSGDGPSVLLIPGTFSDSRNYHAVVRGLDQSFDLILIENRGLGGSWPPPDAPSIEQCAEDAFRVLNSLNVKSAFVGGHSLGGMIALEMGRQRADRIRGMISIEGWTNSQAADDAFQRDMKSTLSPELLAVLDEYRKDVLQRWTDEQRSAMGMAWRKWDGSEFLKETSLPIFEIYGDRNRPRPDRSKLGLPTRDNVQLVWIAGASHSLLVERPQEVAQAINEFVRQHLTGHAASNE